MFKYSVYDFFRRTWWLDLPLTDVAFNDPIDGGSTLSATLPIGDDIDPDLLGRYDRRLVKRRSWVLAIDPTTNQIVWHGVLVKRPWSTADQHFSLEFQHPKEWWLGHRLHSVTSKGNTWATMDKFALARLIVRSLADNRGAEVDVVDYHGTPRVVFGSDLCGVTSSYKLDPYAFKNTYDILQEISAGDKGFEWDLVAQWNPDDGRPEMRLNTWYPQMNYPGRVTLTYGRDGRGNLIDIPDEWPDDASDSFTEVFALGGGDEGNKWVAGDRDPLINKDPYEELMITKATTYENITSQKQLAQYARAERIASEHNMGTIEVGLDVNQIKVADYLKGMRARLRVRDKFLNIDKPAVRIIERKFADENRDSLAEMTLVLDLNDYELPDGVDA